MFWLIPALAAVLAVVAGLIGAGAAERSWSRLQDHARRLTAAPQVALLRSDRLQLSLARIRRDGEDVKPLLDRLGAALSAIRQGMDTLRLREAVIALRLARVALGSLRTLL
ncbi:MAG: hypothetical protein WB615_01795 [Candidatus Tumulicola sp.]